MDMEALFAEMRKAQTGGVDFAAEAAEKREREEKAERDARRAAAGDPDDGSDDSDGSDSDVDESRGERPRGLTSAEERRLWSLSHAGRASAERGVPRGRQSAEAERRARPGSLCSLPSARAAPGRRRPKSEVARVWTRFPHVAGRGLEQKGAALYVM